MNRCDICDLLVQHLKLLNMELEYEEIDLNAKEATLMEMKCYYWLIKAYLGNILRECDCDYNHGLRNLQKNLKEKFNKEGIAINESKQKCDICKILPCEIFALLNNACKITDSEKMESMIEELQYHVTLAILYEEVIGKCTECDEYIEYIACLKFACEFIKTRNLKKIQQYVYYWKMARNNDEIWGCANALNMDEVIESKDVELTDYLTVYLDFNVYQRYEDDDVVKAFFNTLIQQEKVGIIYSGTHLEEVLRMNNRECEKRRIDSIHTLTNGKIVVVGNDKKTVICIQDVAKRLKHVTKYLKMNEAAEERECIVAEAREHLRLHDFSEQQDKAIGSSSLRKILFNISNSGKKINEQLPDEEKLNEILRYVGTAKSSIREYMDSLKCQEKEFNEVRTTIVSIAELLNILGLHGDKIQKKTNPNAVYPIYHKESYRTIRSGYYDNDHLAFAIKCTYFVTTDSALYKKAKEIYEFLGVDTVPIMLNDFMKLSALQNKKETGEN